MAANEIKSCSSAKFVVKRWKSTTKQQTQLFLELMPCALEALTVIKTSVAGQLFSTCERTGRMQKTGCPHKKQKKAKQHKQTTNKPPPRNKEDTQRTKWNNETTLSEQVEPSRIAFFFLHCRCRKGTYGPPLLPRGLPQRWLPKRPFVKNGADCRPSIFGWRSSWAGMCWPTGCTQWPLLGSHELLFNRAARGSQRNPYEEKAYRGHAHREVQAWWEQCQEWMLYYKCQCAPLVRLSACIPGQGRGCSCWGWCIYGILRKEVANKRGHLPAQATTSLAGCERPAWARRCRSGHDGHLILYMDGMEDYFIVEEMLWGAEKGASSFTFCEFSLAGFVCVGLCCLLVLFALVGHAGENSCI